MRKALLFFMSLVFGALSSQTETTTDKTLRFPYTLDQPDTSFTLPSVLREISGITGLDSATIACIEDENGIIFTYDLRNNSIKERVQFGRNGDYEDLTRVGAVFYVLRSDGMLYEVSEKNKSVIYNTRIPCKNNEGLCYDKENNRLLIGCKVRIAKGRLNKDKRAIYAFDLSTKKTSQLPVFDFDVQQLIRAIAEKNILLPYKLKRKGTSTGPLLHFSISAIGIHPVTKQLFVLSSLDHLLFAFNMKGEAEYIELLDPLIFNQPEGIMFLENGDMLISNEGQEKKATLLRFGYKPD